MEEIKGIENNKVFFGKLREDVISPVKNSKNESYDVYTNFEEDYMLIEKGETVLVPTGLISAFSEDYLAVLGGTGLISTEHNVIFSGFIRSCDRNEWFVSVTNRTEKTIILAKTSIIDEKTITIADTRHGKPVSSPFIYVTDKVLGDPYNVLVYPYEKAICQVLFLPSPKLELVELSSDVIKRL